MAAPNVVQLFVQLDELIREQDDSSLEKAIQVCDKILKLASDDADALACKAIALINLNKFEEALAVAEKVEALALQAGYCYYRLGRYTDALQAIDKLPKPLSESALHLQAQVYYRLDKFSESISIYEKLSAQDPSNVAIRTNMAAAHVSSGQPKDLGYLRKGSDSYELAYNVACGEIVQGNFEKALKSLQHAQELCEQESGDDVDVADEVAIIRIQAAYVKQLLGHTKEALEEYNQVLANKPSDATVVAVASNNIVSLRTTEGGDLFDSAKKLKAASGSNVEATLSSEQKRIVHTNQVLVSLKMNKFDQAKQEAAALQARYPESVLLRVLVDMGSLSASASASVSGKKSSTATKTEELLQKYIQESGSANSQQQKDTQYLQLTLAQIQLARGDHARAIQTLSAIESLRHQPAWVAVLVRLYTLTNDADKAINVLNEAIAHWKKASGANAQANLAVLLRESAQLQLANKKYPEAAATYEQLLALSPSESSAVVGLVIALTQFDPAKAEQYAQSLPRVDLAGKVDVDALENAPSFAIRNVVKKSNNPEESAALAAQSNNSSSIESEIAAKKAQRKKKKKKVRLPKLYNPAVPPDPERWLPKHERSYAKKKGKKGVGRGGAQGAATPVAVATSPVPAAAAAAKGKQPVTPTPAAAPAAAAAPANTRGKKKHHRR